MLAGFVFSRSGFNSSFQHEPESVPLTVVLDDDVRTVTLNAGDEIFLVNGMETRTITLANSTNSVSLVVPAMGTKLTTRVRATVTEVNGDKKVEDMGTWEVSGT